MVCFGSTVLILLCLHGVSTGVPRKTRHLPIGNLQVAQNGKFQVDDEGSVGYMQFNRRTGNENPLNIQEPVNIYNARSLPNNPSSKDRDEISRDFLLETLEELFDREERDGTRFNNNKEIIAHSSIKRRSPKNENTKGLTEDENIPRVDIAGVNPEYVDRINHDSPLNSHEKESLNKKQVYSKTRGIPVWVHKAKVSNIFPPVEISDLEIQNRQHENSYFNPFTTKYEFNDSDGESTQDRTYEVEKEIEKEISDIEHFDLSRVEDVNISNSKRSDHSEETDKLNNKRTNIYVRSEVLDNDQNWKQNLDSTQRESWFDVNKYGSEGKDFHKAEERNNFNPNKHSEREYQFPSQDELPSRNEFVQPSWKNQDEDGNYEHDVRSQNFEPSKYYNQNGNQIKDDTRELSQGARTNSDGLESHSYSNFDSHIQFAKPDHATGSEEKEEKTKFVRESPYNYFNSPEIREGNKVEEKSINDNGDKGDHVNNIINDQGYINGPDLRFHNVEWQNQGNNNFHFIEEEEIIRNSPQESEQRRQFNRPVIHSNFNSRPQSEFRQQDTEDNNSKEEDQRNVHPSQQNEPHHQRHFSSDQSKQDENHYETESRHRESSSHSNGPQATGFYSFNMGNAFSSNSKQQ